MDLVALIARVLFSAIFISSGIAHFRKHGYMSEYARAMGVPSPGGAVATSGALIVAGGVMTLLGLWPDLGAIFVIAFLVPTTYYMHGFWRLDDAEQRANQQVHFMKNLAMTGGALALLALYLCAGDRLGYALTAPLFG